MSGAAERLRAMTLDAIAQYDRELNAGGEPIYPAWASDIMEVLDAADGGRQPAASAGMTDTNVWIDAAQAYADKYDGDDRQDIKTDIMNAFYQGGEWMRKHDQPAMSGTPVETRIAPAIPGVRGPRPYTVPAQKHHKPRSMGLAAPWTPPEPTPRRKSWWRRIFPWLGRVAT